MTYAFAVLFFISSLVSNSIAAPEKPDPEAVLQVATEESQSLLPTSTPTLAVTNSPTPTPASTVAPSPAKKIPSPTAKNTAPIPMPTRQIIAPTNTPQPIQQTPETSGGTYTGSLSGDRDCGDFATHAEAQAYFVAKGGNPSNNVDRLDADHDGLACESLP